MYGDETRTIRKVAQKYIQSLEKWCLKKDGENQLDGSCEKKKHYTESRREGVSYRKQNERQLTGLVTLVLDDLKRQDTGMREEALFRTLWRTRFERDYGSVARQTTE